MGMACIFLRQAAIILDFGKMMFFMGMELPIILKEIYRTKECGKMGNLKNENHNVKRNVLSSLRLSFLG
jgi:hypothetical protein